MEKFVIEATDEKYAANQHFWTETWRCWWCFQFVPSPNEQPDNRTTFVQNEVSAILRLYSDGQINLEWHPLSHQVDLLSKSEKNRVLHVDALSEQGIEKWLEDFIARMLELREKNNKALY